MDKDIADKLMQSLETRKSIMTPDRNVFYEMLLNTDVPEGSRFARLPRNVFQEAPDSTATLSLRRLMRNEALSQYDIPEWMASTYRAMAPMFGINNSDILVGDALLNRQIVTLMQHSTLPYSVIGKFKLYDFDTGRTSISTIPILVIPGFEKEHAIYEWESRNTRREKEKELLGIVRI